MQLAKTVQGVAFHWKRKGDGGFDVRCGKKTRLTVSKAEVEFVRAQIASRSPALMGARRKPLVADSIGEAIRLELVSSPQKLSYLVPVLEAEGPLHGNAIQTLRD